MHSGDKKAVERIAFDGWKDANDKEEDRIKGDGPVFDLEGWTYAGTVCWAGTWGRTRFGGESKGENGSSVEDMLVEHMSNKAVEDTGLELAWKRWAVDVDGSH